MDKKIDSHVYDSHIKTQGMQFLKEVDYKKILIINLGGIGDFLLSTPAIRGLRNRYPQGELYLLCSPRITSFAKRLTYIDRVYTFHIGYGGLVSWGGILKNIKALLELRRKKFDLAINMRTISSEKGARRIRLILRIIKPELTAGRDTEKRGDFLDIKIEETYVGKKYEMGYDIDTVKALGIEVIDKSIDFPVSPETEEKLKILLEKEGISPQDILIGLHPGGMPSKRWPIEYFLEVVKGVYEKFSSSKFVVTGTKEESYLARKLKKAQPEIVLDLTGKLNIEESGALIKRCTLYICNDTGPMHIAAVLKTPLIAIFGPGDITRYDPRNISAKAVVLYKKVDCAPCERLNCSDLKCLRSILPQEVIDAVLSYLSQNFKNKER